MSKTAFEALRAVADAPRRLEKGSLLFSRDAPVTVVHLLLEGAVVLRRATADGALLTLDRARGPQVLAEASLYAERYHCEAVALSAGVAAAVPKPRALDALCDGRDVAEDWARTLARRLQSARERAEVLRLRTVAERLDAWLSIHGPPPEGGWRAVADEIGVSPEALYRERARRRIDASPVDASGG